MLNVPRIEALVKPERLVPIRHLLQGRSDIRWGNVREVVPEFLSALEGPANLLIAMRTQIEGIANVPDYWHRRPRPLFEPPEVNNQRLRVLGSLVNPPLGLDSCAKVLSKSIETR